MVKHYLVKGRVQGVGFRWFVQREAAEIGLRGWVRNTDQGHVEVVACGEPEDVAELEGALRKGSRGSRVDDVIQHDLTEDEGARSGRLRLKELGKLLEMTPKTIDCEPLKDLIRTVPDFPKPGILFYDITTLLKDKAGFAKLIDAFAQNYIGKEIDLVLGIEARGFIFGPALAYRLNAGFVPVRKPKKLPAPVARVNYDLEYGSDALEIHLDAIAPGQRVIVVDDLLATGGTMQATVQLVRQLGGEIAGLGFAIELDFLKGRAKLQEYDVFSLLHYDE